MNLRCPLQKDLVSFNAYDPFGREAIKLKAVTTFPWKIPAK